MLRERRWLIVAHDGRHVTVGRATDPTDEEVERAGAALLDLGLGGWLVVMEGFYHRPGSEPHLLVVRQISPCSTTWEEAAGRFESIRNRSHEADAA
jgi:hypothetical protein